MSNSEIAEKKSPRSVLSTNLQLSWALMDFGSKFSVPVENDGESDKRTCSCPNVYIYIHTFLYRRHYRFYPPDLFVCGLNPHMFFQSGVHHIDTLYMFDDMFYTDTLYIRTTLRIILLFLNYHLLW